jgi:uncharacterized membrane protein (Fun14 family)
MIEPMPSLSCSLPPLGCAGIAGGIVGYTAKKITKLTAILAGALFTNFTATELERAVP